MQLLCLFQHVRERGRERKRGRKNMNMPHLCSPTMRGSYEKTFLYKGKRRSIIEDDLVSKTWL